MTVTAALLDHGDVLKGRVLDVGCGSMAYKRLAFEGVEEWVGLDIRPVAQIQSDMCDMEEAVEDESFDTIVCIDALQYAADPLFALREFARVLKPEGRVLIIAPNSCEDDHEALWGFRANGLKFLLKQAGFDVDSIRTTSRQFRCEYENSKLAKYGFQVPEEIKALIERLDDAYPHITVAVGTKAALAVERSQDG